MKFFMLRSYLVVAFLLASPTVQSATLTLEQVSEEVQNLKEEMKQIKLLLSRFTTTMTHGDTTQTNPDEYGILYPRQHKTTIYVLPEDAVLTKTVSAFVDFLKKEEPNLDIKKIKEVSNIPQHERPFAIILYLHRLVTEKIEGHYNAKKLLKCGDESGGRCVFTILRLAKANLDLPPVRSVGAIAAARGLLPDDIIGLEFRDLHNSFYLDSYNKGELESLRQIITENAMMLEHSGQSE